VTRIDATNCELPRTRARCHPRAPLYNGMAAPVAPDDPTSGWRWIPVKGALLRTAPWMSHGMAPPQTNPRYPRADKLQKATPGLLWDVMDDGLLR